MRYYLTSVLLLLLLLLLSVTAFVGGLVHYHSVRERRMVLERSVLDMEQRLEAVVRDHALRAANSPPASQLLQGWAQALSLCKESSDTPLVIRGGLETLAQQRLGLVTDQFVAPEPVRLAAASGTVWVQRVSLRATGERLSSLLVWLGEAECLFPLARVEGVELLAGPSGNESLKLSLAHPVSRQNNPFLE